MHHVLALCAGSVALVALVAAAAAAAPSRVLILSRADDAVAAGAPGVLGVSGDVVARLGRGGGLLAARSTAATPLARVPFEPASHLYFFAEAIVDGTEDWTAPRSDGVQLLWHEPARALFRARKGPAGPEETALADAFDRTTEIVTLPDAPVRPVPTAARARLEAAAAALAYRQDVAELVRAVETESLGKYARFLTGEDADSPLLSRNSYSEGGVVAGIWAARQFENAGFTTERPVFNDAFCPNVVAEKRGAIEPNKIVILGAHLDDRATGVNDPAQRAPGANDDGSGSSMLLEAARVIASTNASFRYTLRIIAFCGEEQGLVGSRAYALAAAQRGDDIVAMLQGDMIAYQAGSAPEVSFVTRYTDPTLTAIVTNITATYVPTLRRSTTTACCSDHQSFYEQSVPSAGFVEAGGYSIDVCYHRECDLVERADYSLEQLTLITQAMLASTAVLAELL